MFENLIFYSKNVFFMIKTSRGLLNNLFQDNNNNMIAENFPEFFSGMFVTILRPFSSVEWKDYY